MPHIASSKGKSQTGKLAKAHRGWMSAAEVAARGISIVLFALLWVFAFAPLAIIIKLTGRRFLPQFRGDEPTYYLKKPPIDPSMRFLRRQW